MMQNLLENFEKHLFRQAFFKPREKILIACSGGPDSVALVHLLKDLAPFYSWKLGVLHFNHRLRSAAKDDERFVRDLAKKMKLPFFNGAGDVVREAGKNKHSIEEAARAMRYTFFTKAAKRMNSKVALAHTLDDQAETVLMRVLQGTGLRGLQGIRETNRMNGIVFARPLLIFTKKEILSFLRFRKIRYRKDESNDSLQFVRNRIRLKLLPMLRRDFNPRVVESLARIPAIVKEENSLLDQLEKDAWRKTVKKGKRKGLELKRSIFMSLPGPLQFRVLEKALKKLDLRSGLSFEAWARIRAGLSRSRNCWSLPKDIDFSLTPKRIMVYKKKTWQKQV